MTKMRTTIELAKDCGFSPTDRIGYYYAGIGELEAFRLAVEADFVSRCELAGFRFTHLDGSYELSFNNVEQKVSAEHKLYTLPKETK